MVLPEEILANKLNIRRAILIYLAHFVRIIMAINQPNQSNQPNQPNHKNYPYPAGISDIDIANMNICTDIFIEDIIAAPEFAWDYAALGISHLFFETSNDFQ